MPGGGAPAKRLRFSPDGRFLAVRHADSRLRVWQLERPERPAIEVEGIGPIETWSFRSDSHRLALGLADGSVSIYDPFSGRIVDTLRLDPESKNIRNVRYRPDGKALAVCTRDGKDIQVWDLVSRTRWRVRLQDSPTSDIDWRHDGVHLAANNGGVLFFYDAPAQYYRRFFRHTGGVTSFGFDPSGGLLISDSWDNTMRVWDVASGDQILRVDNERFLGFSADGHALASIRAGRRVTFWRFHRNSFSTSLASSFSFRTVSQMAMAPDGGFLAVSFDEGDLVLMDPTTGREQGELPTGCCSTPLFLPDGDALITWDGTGLRRWRIQPLGDAEGTLLIGHPAFLGLKTSSSWGRAALSADGQTVALVSGHSVELVDLQAPEEPRIFTAPAAVNSLAVDPEMRFVAGAIHDEGLVRVWSVSSGEIAGDLPNQLQCVDFTPDGRHLITGSTDEFSYWDVESWNIAHRIPRTVFGYSVGALSRSGNLLALGISSTRLALLHADSGREIVRVETHFPMLQLAFDPSGRRLLVAAPGRLDVIDLARMELELGDRNLGWERSPFPHASLPGRSEPPRVEVTHGELSGTASQSTVSYGGVASRAIDGRTGGAYQGGSVTHTREGDPAPWWELDLAEIAEVHRILIWNRTDDCCKGRLRNFEIVVFDADRNEVFTRRVPHAPNPLSRPFRRRARSADSFAFDSSIPPRSIRMSASSAWPRCRSSDPADTSRLTCADRWKPC